MSALQLVPRSVTPERPAHLVRVAVPRLNKQDHIADYLKQLQPGERNYDLNWAEVTETRRMNAAEWNEFVTNLLEDRDWLAGKGGAGNWNPAFEQMTDVEICNLPRHGERGFTGGLSMDDWHRTMFLFVVAVVAPTGQTIYIDPEGYNYARYVAFPASATMPEGKTRQEREKDEAQAHVAARKAEIALQIANPPVVPADHGLRFFWNGIKAKDGELKYGLQNAYYSLGNLYDYPADTLSINAKDYRGFSAEVRTCFHVRNNSDSYSDYHDHDHIRVCPNHPLYSLVMQAYQAQERHETARKAKRMAKHGY